MAQVEQVGLKQQLNTRRLGTSYQLARQSQSNGVTLRLPYLQIRPPTKTATDHNRFLESLIVTGSRISNLIHVEDIAPTRRSRPELESEVQQRSFVSSEEECSPFGSDTTDAGLCRKRPFFSFSAHRSINHESELRNVDDEIINSVELLMNLARGSSTALSTQMHGSGSDHAMAHTQEYMVTPADEEANKTNYRMLLRQQPLRGRVCGFTDTRDRRLLDPPPVLELIVNNLGDRVDLHDLNVSHLICHASLWSADGNDERHTVFIPNTSKEAGNGDLKNSKRKLAEAKGAAKPIPRSDVIEADQVVNMVTRLPTPPPMDIAAIVNVAQQAPPVTPTSRQNRTSQTLIGTSVATPMLLRDVDGVEKYFFVFPDLSVRVCGKYRLSFQLLSLNSMTGSGQAVNRIITLPFEMFPPKTFPGMTESTKLSKCLSRQGIHIHIRKDCRDFSGAPVLE
ncbi:hypothetical protein SeLEV6574_g00967 [Synchytrium endobioticum]|uniref:Velvet domain-containing protein n=1 Tax=Synchytrium endobioticum TaxID=286115 RepID=A0A507DFH3_9FUNG|nr:hypothetical protein SeLEV6574_g02764 [Synchytrium endobioticum]TPX50353.1 hypothetical protein SeLEV6574_g00967 [Synchytrium endobioticum]